MTTHTNPRRVSRQTRLPWPGSAHRGSRPAAGVPRPAWGGGGSGRARRPGACGRGAHGGRGCCCRPAPLLRQSPAGHLQRRLSCTEAGLAKVAEVGRLGEAALPCGRVGEDQEPSTPSGWYPKIAGGKLIFLPP